MGYSLLFELPSLVFFLEIHIKKERRIMPSVCLCYLFFLSQRVSLALFVTLERDFSEAVNDEVSPSHVSLVLWVFFLLTHPGLMHHTFPSAVPSKVHESVSSLFLLWFLTHSSFSFSLQLQMTITSRRSYFFSSLPLSS